MVRLKGRYQCIWNQGTNRQDHCSEFQRSKCYLLIQDGGGGVYSGCQQWESAQTSCSGMSQWTNGSLREVVHLCRPGDHYSEQLLWGSSYPNHWDSRSFSDGVGGTHIKSKGATVGSPCLSCISEIFLPFNESSCFKK